MYVIEVIPLNVGHGVSTLSYFSSVPYERGSIITIPVRSRDTDAVVMKVAPVSSLKTALRAATFTLRKLPPQVIVGRLSETFLSLVDTIALERALNPLEVLTALVHKRRHVMGVHAGVPAPARLHQVSLFVAPKHERMAEYQTVVREAFAHGSSVLFVAPTARGVREALRDLSHGIEDRVVVLSGDIKSAKGGERMERLNDDRPLLIITTPTFAYIERADLGHVIIDTARSKGYRGIRRPYLDHIHALLTHARLDKRTVILGDLVPHAEHVEALRERRYLEHGEHPKRINLPGKLSVIHQKKDHDGIIPFSLFSPELLSGIQKVMEKRGRVFLLAARRGLSPLVACADCGHIFRDPESGAPLSLHRTQKNGVEERFLVSPASGYRERMCDVCPQCGGWRLRERGVGIQQVETELKKALPQVAITVMDHTTATTDVKAKKIAEVFYGIHSQVMLGTALALPYLDKPIDASGIVSMDSLLAAPSWRQQEEVFATLLSLRECTEGPVWAQTRHRADDKVLALAVRGEIGAFYDEEIDARRAWSYPPYAAFILLSFMGTKEVVAATEAMLQTLFAQYGIIFYGAPTEDGVHAVRRGLMRFPRESWPHEQVVAAIRTLPTTIKVEFNPERIV
jgi:primosomal protein N'